MKQKTAMMELIDIFEADAKEYELDNVTIYSIINAYKKEAIKRLEKEKEQMGLSDNNGFNRSLYLREVEYGGSEYWDEQPLSFESYYNETYKQD